MNNLNRSLKELMSTHNISSKELSSQTGVGQTQISRILSGASKAPTINTVFSIAQYFKVSIEQLLGYEKRPSALPTEAIPSVIPLVEWSTIPQLLTNQFDYSSIKFTSSIATSFKASRQSFACKVQDPSMEPMFCEDSIIVVDPAKTVQHKDFVVAVDSKHIYFKQYTLVDNEIYLRPINREFETKKSTPNLTIVGVVTESILKCKD